MSDRCAGLLSCIGKRALELTTNELLALEAKYVNGDATLAEDIAELLNNFKKYKASDRKKIIELVKSVVTPKL